jgi:ankyrin repeat protein
MRSSKCLSAANHREVLVYVPKIAAVIAIGLIVLTTFCSASFAQDQGQTLIEAARKGDLKHVQELMKNGVSVEARNEKGWTALMAAANKGHLAVVQFLIDKGANVNSKDEWGGTALMYADMANLEMVRFLVEKGADINSSRRWGGNSDRVCGRFFLIPSSTLLMHALAQFETVEFLIDKGADVNGKTEDGRTALMVAAARCDRHMVNLLIDKGPDVNAKDGAGWT